MQNRVSAVYQIVNTVTGDRYVGSSKNVMRRWSEHKCPSVWKENPNSQMYQDFQKYGIDKFRFQILAPVMTEHLKQVEQEFIEMLQPAYNNYNANGRDVEKFRKAQRKAHRKYDNKLCFYDGETLTLKALRQRFSKAGIEHPNIEAKKYLLQGRTE